MNDIGDFSDYNNTTDSIFNEGFLNERLELNNYDYFEPNFDENYNNFISEKMCSQSIASETTGIDDLSNSICSEINELEPQMSQTGIDDLSNSICSETNELESQMSQTETNDLSNSWSNQISSPSIKSEQIDIQMVTPQVLNRIGLDLEPFYSIRDSQLNLEYYKSELDLDATKDLEAFGALTISDKLTSNLDDKFNIKNTKILENRTGANRVSETRRSDYATSTKANTERSREARQRRGIISKSNGSGGDDGNDPNRWNGKKLYGHEFDEPTPLYELTEEELERLQQENENPRPIPWRTLIFVGIVVSTVIGTIVVHVIDARTRNPSPDRGNKKD